ncbi:MAG TPA: SDR family oxidoreductase, partial [Candidatus Acidoferrales bacterium]|nr:SDR family oxidoreductase [Candidatus Acidoferrales bacterium]
SNPRLELVRGDIRDPEAVKNVLRDADVVIHLAAIVGYPACAKDPWLARTTNVDGTLNIARLSSPHQVIIYPSSLSNYGTVPDSTCTEEVAPAPITLYGITKMEGEKALLNRGNAIIFRPATAFGLSPQMRLDLLFNEFVYRALREKYLVVYEPHHMRAFIHVRDLGRAFLFALDNGERMLNQIYNLGSESLNVRKGELAERIRRKVDFVLNISETGEDPDKRNYTVSFSKLRRAGYETTISIDEGIDELLRGLPAIDVMSPFNNVTHV